jgi:hypothetical protein
MKNILILLLLASPILGQDREIRYSMDFVYFEIQLDSVNTNLTYTYHDVFFLKKYNQTMTTDSTGVDGYKSSGTYCITFVPDTSRLYPVTDGDTDSLHIYVKELSPDSAVIANDSTIVTPADVGLNFDLNKTYKYTFTLAGCGAGYRVYARRQDDVGAIRLKVWARR